MTYVASEARRRLLDTVGQATHELGAALAALGDAYEQLDDDSADRLEAALFRPLQHAYARAQRTHAGFAARHGLAGGTFAPGAPAEASAGARELIGRAVDAAAEADAILSELQDSMMPVEVGDAELRAGLAEVRRLISDVEARARAFLRGLGR